MIDTTIFDNQLPRPDENFQCVNFVKLQKGLDSPNL